MSPKDLLNNPTQSQVFELLGRVLYACNVIERKLRWMNKHRGDIWTGKTPEELLMSIKKSVEKQQKEDKIPLGPIGQDLIDTIYSPCDNKDFEEAEGKSLLVFKIDYKNDWTERFDQAKMKFKNFIDTRNYLVHYLARDFDLTDAESCRKAFDDLKKKSKVVKDAIEFFDQDYNMMKSVLQECCNRILNFLSEYKETESPTITKSKDGLNLLKLLAQSESEIARGRVIHQKDLFKYLEKIL